MPEMSWKLYNACYRGDLDRVKQLTEASPTNSTPASLAGRWKDLTVLHAACAGGHPTMADWLLQKDPKLLHQNRNDGYTPFHSACFGGHPTMAAWLLQKDPTLLHQNTIDGSTPFHVACFGGHPTIADWLLKKDPTLMHQNAIFGLTPLHVACKYGRLDTAQWLVRNGADLTAQWGVLWGQTPIDLAKAHGHHALAQALQAMVDTTTTNGELPSSQHSAVVSNTPTLPETVATTNTASEGDSQPVAPTPAAAVVVTPDPLTDFVTNLYDTYRHAKVQAQRQAWLDQQPQTVSTYHNNLLRLFTALPTLGVGVELKTLQAVGSKKALAAKLGLSVGQGFLEGICPLIKCLSSPLEKALEDKIDSADQRHTRHKLERLRHLGQGEQATAVAHALAYHFTVHRAQTATTPQKRTVASLDPLSEIERPAKTPRRSGQRRCLGSA